MSQLLRSGNDRKYDIIVLDDDESSSEEDGATADNEHPNAPLTTRPPQPNVASNCPLTATQHVAAIQSLMDILQLTDRNYAERILMQFDFDVQRAVSHLLLEQRNTKKALTKRSLFQNQPMDNKNRLSTEAVATSNDKNLSPQWHEAYHAVGDSDSPFYTDQDFRPESSSIDGRIRQQDTSAAGSAATTTLSVKCRCGVLAKPMSVQSEGPDFGRFYLACGQKGSLKRRAPVVQERKSPVKNANANDGDDAYADGTATTITTTRPVMRNPYAKQQPPPPVTTTAMTKATTPSTPPQRFGCDFFQWDRNGTLGATVNDAYAMGRFQKVSWKHLGIDTGHVLCRNPSSNKSRSDSIQQGSIGNCWFLSALAVVAEQPYLIDRVLGHDALNERGVYQVNLCLDGKWTPVIVDSYLPVIEKDVVNGDKRHTATRSPKKVKITRQQSYQQTLLSGSGSAVNYRTAFCATPDRQLWPALIEKAYAKAHGSYANLSGGFIAEGLTDLTGAPTETVLFNDSALMNHDELWVRLLSFAQAGFIMGVATSRGGDGLVGGHAYSILDVVEIPDLMVGEQAKVTDFFGTAKSECEEVLEVFHPHNTQRKQMIRLVRIRNPWGKREWKGEWSVDSERWTKALRNRLGSTSYSKGDGTFFMAFSDMIHRFHHLDVAKTRQSWAYSHVDGLFQPSSDPISSSRHAYTLIALKRTWSFVSLVQPKKRSNTSRSYYYCDVSLVLLKRRYGSIEWSSETIILAGVKRTVSAEIFLDPGLYEYVCLPISCIGSRDEGFSFRLSVYSAGHVDVKQADSLDAAAVMGVLHKDLLSRDYKLLYPVAPMAMLCCIHGEGCLYFVALNGLPDAYLSLKLTVDVKAGILVVFGKETDTYDVAPHSQQVLVVLAGNGKFSTATDVAFRYLSSLVRSGVNPSSRYTPSLRVPVRLGSSIPLTVAGDLSLSGIDPSRIEAMGADTVDTHLWISQLGASRC